MSYASDKGYSAERAVEVLWKGKGETVHRPRAGAFLDIGDIVGMPLVQSVKNHKVLRLADWITGMENQMVNAGFDAGVVWHKRVGHAHPDNWYVTTTGRVAVALISAYCDTVRDRP